MKKSKTLINTKKLKVLQKYFFYENVLQVIALFWLRFSAFLYWFFLYESESKSRSMKLLFAMLVGSMITLLP